MITYRDPGLDTLGLAQADNYVHEDGRVVARVVEGGWRDNTSGRVLNPAEWRVRWALDTYRRHLVYVPTWVELGSPDLMPFRISGEIGWAHEHAEDDGSVQLFGRAWIGPRGAVKANVIDYHHGWWLTLGRPRPQATPAWYMRAGDTEEDARWFIAVLQSLVSD